MALINSYRDRPLDGLARRLHDHKALRTALNQIFGQLLAFGVAFTIYSAWAGAPVWLAFTIPLGLLGLFGIYLSLRSVDAWYNERRREDDARFHARLRNIR